MVEKIISKPFKNIILLVLEKNAVIHTIESGNLSSFLGSWGKVFWGLS